MLQFLGLPLKQIGLLVKRQLPLVETLRRQQHVLSGKRRHITAALGKDPAGPAVQALATR